MTSMEEAIEKGHKRYFKNSYWKGLYDDAPEDAKKYYDLIFSQLDGATEPDNLPVFKEMMEGVYQGMSEAGWNYLINNTSNQMAKFHLEQKREQLSQR